MKYIIISFKSRNDTYEFAKILKTNGVILNIINTPRVIASSCSLSIKTDYKNYNLVTYIIRNSNANSLIGVYLIEQIGFSQNVQKIL